MSPPLHNWRAANSLGRGLDSLLGEGARSASGDGTRLLSPGQIEPDPGQPRRHFDADALDELAASIRERGIIQPLIVRPHGNRFRLVAGERRWRAAQAAGLEQVPVVVRELTDTQVFELALIENIQRADLNAMEEAEAYRRLLDEHGHTQDRLARIVGKSRSHVTNLLRLLDLPAPVRSMVEEGRLSMGHARAVLSAADPEAAAREAVQEKLSVRDTEARVRRARPKSVLRSRKAASTGDGVAGADLTALGRQLSDHLGVAVTVTSKGGRGEVVLRYTGMEKLDLICQRLSAEPL